MEAFKSQTQRDVKIKLCDGTIIQAHRVVLVLGAKWFEARLRVEWNKESNTIKCTEHSTLNTQAMINFLYSNEIQLTMESVEEMYQISDYYDILGRMSFSLNLENQRLRGVYVFGRSEGFLSISILLFDGDSLIAKTQMKQMSAI